MKGKKGLITMIALSAGVIAVSLIFFQTAEGALSNPYPFDESTKTSFSDYNSHKAAMYRDALQTGDPEIKKFAQIRVKPRNSEGPDIAKICDLWDYANDEWTIVSDPRGPEFISPVTETAKADLHGDCDDFSVFLSGIINPLGIDTRIASVDNTGISPGHAYPEVYIGYDESDIRTVSEYIRQRYDCRNVYFSYSDTGVKKGYWLNLDWRIGIPAPEGYYIYGESGAIHDIYHPGGEYYGPEKSVAYFYPDGEWNEESKKVVYFGKSKLGESKIYGI